jgi:hypothetical protein
MQLFTAEAMRTGMHKPHFPALQATLVLLGVVALSGVWFGPGRAYAAVAGKTYDLWVSVGPGQSPPPLHTCARFTTTTIRVDVCGPQAGVMVEQSCTNPQNIETFWVGEVLCGGLGLSFPGLAYMVSRWAIRRTSCRRWCPVDRGTSPPVWKAWKPPPVDESWPSSPTR